MILPPDLKDGKKEKFKCPVCQTEYATFEEAQSCMDKNGAIKNKFLAGQKVIVLEGTNKGLIGEITSISFAKPHNTSRPVHTPLYLIKVEKAEKGDDVPLPNFTTALENQLKLYDE